MPAGRPSLYDPAYCERVIELGREGLSIVEMAADLGVSRTTMETTWPAAHPEFLEALEDARNLSQAWWERQGRENLTADKFQAALYSRSMAARFPKDWRETQGREHSGPNGQPIKSERTVNVKGLSESALREIAGLNADNG